MAVWRDCKLGDLLEIKHGYAFKGEFFSDEGDFVLLTPGNFREDGGLKLKGEKEKYYTGEVPDEFVLRKGDLLVAMTDLTQNAPILGSPAFVPEDDRFLHNQRLGKVTDISRDDIVPEFLFYLFNTATVRGQIKGSASGATVRHTSPSRIYEVSVKIPPLPFQRRIAGILSAYDDLIENNLRRIKILEEMARSLYREWFAHFRFPGRERVRMVDSPLGPIPQCWQVKTLGEIAENFDRLRKPLSKMKRAEMQGAYPYYGAAKVFDYVNDYIFDGEYLLMAEDGSVIAPDRAPVLQLVNEKFWPNNHTHILRGKAPVSTHFLYIALSLIDISPYITGAAQPKITQENMNRIPFVCAPQELHHDFDRFITPMISQSQALQRQSANLRHTRDLLLPRLLSGACIPECWYEAR